MVDIRLVSLHGVLGTRSEPHLFISPLAYEIHDPSRQTDPAPLWKRFERAAIVMDLIPSLNPVIGEHYRDLFFTGDLKSVVMPIRMLRLYLGRTFPPTTTQRATGGLVTDFPLDESRYAKLATALAGTIDLPRVEDVAYGMGDVLAHLHFGAGIDGSDAELVIAGGKYHQARCYIFDLNQCSKWLRDDYITCDPAAVNLTVGKWANDTMMVAARRLAMKIFTQERYYPLSTSRLYVPFTKGYTEATQAILSRGPASPAMTLADRSGSSEYARLGHNKRPSRAMMTRANFEGKAAGTTPASPPQ